jgi:hypothetical protein
MDIDFGSGVVVDTMWMTLLISVVLPLVNGLVFKYTSNPHYLKLVNLVLVFIAEAANHALRDGVYLFDNAWLSWVLQSLVAVVFAQTAYQHAYVGLRLTSRPDGILPTNAGIKVGDRLAGEVPPQHVDTVMVVENKPGPG